MFTRRPRSCRAFLRELFLHALLFAGVVLSALSARATTPTASVAPPELVLYVYDSFVAEGGLGRALIPLFEAKCGCRVRTLASGDSLQMLSRLEIDQARGQRSGAPAKAPLGDVIVGLDLQSWGRARKFVHLPVAVAPFPKKDLVEEVRVPEIDEGFVPYDYGPMAFIADTEQLRKLGLPLVSSLHDLLKPEWKRNFIVEDPRTSAPGQGFALFARAVFGGDFAARVAALRKQWLTLAPGWDQAYGLFLRKEAPLVWSYVTSQAYHAEHGDAAGRYRAVMLAEGAPVQIEGAALVGGVELDPKKLRLAREFLEFLVTPAAQALVPTRNWMLPARKGVKLPPSFAALPRPSKIVRLPVAPEEIAAGLHEWSRGLTGATAAGGAGR